MIQQLKAQTALAERERRRPEFEFWYPHQVTH